MKHFLKKELLLVSCIALLSSGCQKPVDSQDGDGGGQRH